MDDSPKHRFNAPPEQQAICESVYIHKAREFHPSEVRKNRVANSRITRRSRLREATTLHDSQKQLVLKVMNVEMANTANSITGNLETMLDSAIAWSAVSTKGLLLGPNGERGRNRLLSVRGAKYVGRARQGSPMDRLLADVDGMLSTISDSIYNRQVPGWSLDG